LTYAALEATLKMFLNPNELVKSHPTLRMLTESVSKLKRRGRRLIKLIGDVEGLQIDLVESNAQTGSGALPLEEIASCAVAIVCDGVQALVERLRRYEIPVMGYVRGDRLFLDLRTIRNDELKIVADAVQGRDKG
jgi:L-seryl-tRNA(Ser) seleniumtransferase